MSTWVEEFHDFAGNNSNSGQFGAMVTGGTMKRFSLFVLFIYLLSSTHITSHFISYDPHSTFVPKKPSRKETLEAELKLLEWHKLANDAALKIAAHLLT